MALEYVLHARYYSGLSPLGSKTYGNGLDSQGFDCLRDLEAPFTSETIDASRQRSVFDYFSAASNVYMPGSAGIFPAGSGNAETGNRRKQATNRVVNFMNNVYFQVGDKIYKWDDVGETWNVSHVMTDKSTTESNCIGLFPVNVGGRPKLVTAWASNANTNWFGASLDGLTDVWEEQEIALGINPTDGDGGIHTTCQFAGRIYFLLPQAPWLSIYWFDYTYLTLGSLPIQGAGLANWVFPAELCVFNNELYCINKDGFGENINIWKMTSEDGVKPQFMAQFPREPSAHTGEDFFSALTSAAEFEGRVMLYVDHVSDDRAVQRPKLIAYYVVSGADEKIGTIDDTSHGFGSIVYQIPDAPATGLQSFQSIGFAGNPLKMMANTLGAGEDVVAAKGERMVVRVHTNQAEKFRGDGEFTNNKTVISVASRFGMYCSTPQAGAGGGEGNVLFQHTSLPSGEFAFFAFQREGRHRAFPHEQIGGGGRISVVDNNGDPIIGMTLLEPQPIANRQGIIRLNYQMHTTPAHPNGTPVNVRFFYDTNGHAPERPCTLITSDVGELGQAGSISGNIIFGIAADSGNHWVDWNAAADIGENGLGNRIMLNGLIAATGTDGSSIAALNSPTDLGGLALWLDASDVSTVASGTGVSSWSNKSTAGVFGSVTQGAAANQPQYLWGDLNGLNGILFDGSDDFLFGKPAAISGTPATIMMVYEPRSSAGDQHMFSLSADTGVDKFPGLTYTDNEWMSIISSGVNTVVSSQDSFRRISETAPRTGINPGVSVNNPHLIIWEEIDFAASSRVDRNDEIETDFTADGTVALSGLSNTTIGRFTGAQHSGLYNVTGKYANAVIYEIVAYSGILTNVDKESLRLYAENKWGL